MNRIKYILTFILYTLSRENARKFCKSFCFLTITILYYNVNRGNYVNFFCNVCQNKSGSSRVIIRVRQYISVKHTNGNPYVVYLQFRVILLHMIRSDFYAIYAFPSLILLRNLLLRYDEFFIWFVPVVGTLSIIFFCGISMPIHESIVSHFDEIFWCS